MNSQSLPLEFSLAATIFFLAFLMMVLFHLYRGKLSSVPSLLLSIPTVILLARFLPTHLLEEMIPLFLRQTVGSFLAFVGILSLLPIAHELCEKAGKQWYRSLTTWQAGS